MLLSFYFTANIEEAWQKLSTARKLNLSLHITSLINYAAFINERIACSNKKQNHLLCIY